MKKHFTLPIITLSVILFVGLGLAVGYWHAYAQGDKSDIPSYIVSKGTLSQYINATGEAGARRIVSVGSRVSGQITKLHVELGQTVKQGDPIADIDSTNQQNDLNTSKAKLASCEAKLAATQQAYTIAETRYTREKGLRKKDATSQENLEEAQNNLAQAKANLQDAQSQLDQARIAVSVAETNLGYTHIVAPMDGMLVSVLVKEGQTLNAGMNTPELVQVANVDEMEIRLQISEGDITLVSPGMPVQYSILSEPGIERSATLTSIDPGLTTLSNGEYTGATNTDKAVYYYGNLIVDNKDQTLRIGMTIQSRILTGYTENALLVPLLAVQTIGQEKRVTVLLPSGKQETRTVSIGLADSVNAEVLSGLAEGEVVLMPSLTTSSSTQSGMMPPPRM